MNRNELQHKKNIPDAHSNRSVKSIISKYLVTGATILTLGCGAQATSGMVASLVNVPMGSAKTSTTQVIPDKNKATETEKKEEKKTEISIEELKGYQLKFKEKQGAYYETVLDNEGFYMDLALKKPIALEDGKKGLLITAWLSGDEEKLKKGGNDAGVVFIELIDMKTKEILSAWAFNFDEMREKYPNLKSFHIIAEQGIDDSAGEYVQLHVIPAISKKVVENGLIGVGLPTCTIPVYKNSNEYKAGMGCNKITVSPEQ